jgi:hypothetical protein
MSKPKIYTIKRQFVTLRLTKQEWKDFIKLTKINETNQTTLATAIMRRTIKQLMEQPSI